MPHPTPTPPDPRRALHHVPHPPLQKLLGYVDQDKQSDTLKARLCERFENVVLPSASVAGPGPTGGDAAAAGAAVPPGVAAAAAAAEAAAATAAGVHREWRSLAACLAALGAKFSEKGLRMVMERLRCYKHALGSADVHAVFQVRLVAHGRVRMRVTVRMRTQAGT